MFETIWNFIKDNWVWFVVGGVGILSLGRAMTKNPKYRLKEIAKNPLRIFWLFAHAVDEAVDTINDAVDLVRDVSEIIEPITGDSKIGKTIKAVNDIADAVDAANNILEAVDQVAEAIGIEEPEKAAEPVEGE
jgi:hypothetical protein